MIYNQKIMHITLVTISLSCGGAERAAVLVAEGLVKKGHKVSLITITGNEKDFYKVPDEVYRIALNVAKDSPTLIHALWNNLYRLWVLRKVISSLQPDVIISISDRANILTLLSLIQKNYLVIANEQNNPSADTGLWKKLDYLTYPYAAKLISVSQGIDAYFDWLPITKRAVIYNPLTPIKDEQAIVSLPEGVDPSKKWIIAMGRLVPQKNFSLLLSAFYQIADKYPDWQVLIFGEGELRLELEKLRDNLGFNQQVILPGIISNPFPILQNAKLFVMSSRWEGLPLALLEAMACGLPVISTDCPSGPREIIRDGIDGILVPNEDLSELAKAMDYLMSSEPDRQRLAAKAQEGVKRFSIEKIVERWEELLNEVTKERVK